MRLLLLTARPELETNRRLELAARARGVDTIIMDAAKVTAISGDVASLEHATNSLLEPRVDVALARVGNWRPESVLAALEVVVAAGINTPNPPDAIRIGRDHWRSVYTLSSAGLPVPKSLASGDPEELAGAAASSLGFPVVVKQRRSRMGVGVIRCDTRDHLDAVLDSLWRVGDEVIVQRYVPTDGTSLRLVLVGGEVVAAARFQAPEGDWRSNAARGGSVHPYRPSDTDIELAQSAAKAVGLGVCGVDLLPGKTSLVGEINPTPGFLSVEAATGQDVASAVVDYLMRSGSATSSAETDVW